MNTIESKHIIIESAFEVSQPLRTKIARDVLVQLRIEPVDIVLLIMYTVAVFLTSKTLVHFFLEVFFPFCFF